MVALRRRAVELHVFWFYLASNSEDRPSALSKHSLASVELMSAVHLIARAISFTARRRKDPWPLPHSPQHLASTTTASDIPPPVPIARPRETIHTTRARLIYQSRKRGTLESDLLLSTFARDHLHSMSIEELREYDKVASLLLLGVPCVLLVSVAG